MITRRKFIRNTAIVSAGLLLINSACSDSDNKKPHVIIIGAGLAGLSAAYQLTEKNKNIKVTILESSNRVGGRVFSHTIDTSENLVVELGAEWIGESHCRLLKLIDEMGLTCMLENNQFDTRLIYKGCYYRNCDYSPAWEDKLKTLLHDFNHCMCESDKVELDKIDWWRYLVNKGCIGIDLDIRELLDSTDFGETIRNVSALSALEEYAKNEEVEVCDKRNHLIDKTQNQMDYKIKGGNERLVDKLVERLEKRGVCIKRGQIVYKINQEGKKVKVYCKGINEPYKADKIICTAPAFAAKKIEWEPELSEEMSMAMNQLQYCRINKNAILFENKFWGDESFDMVTDTPIHYLYHATKNQSSPTGKGVLISYTIGDKAAVIANQSEAFKADLLQQSLSPYLQQSLPPSLLSPYLGNIKNIIKKQVNYYWGKGMFSEGDYQYSEGAYAIYGKGQYAIQSILKQPHVHTHFAGEHLADDWQGFMEGAIQTGDDAAKEVLSEI